MYIYVFPHATTHIQLQALVEISAKISLGPHCAYWLAAVAHHLREAVSRGHYVIGATVNVKGGDSGARRWARYDDLKLILLSKMGVYIQEGVTGLREYAAVCDGGTYFLCACARPNWPQQQCQPKRRRTPPCYGVTIKRDEPILPRPYVYSQKFSTTTS